MPNFSEVSPQPDDDGDDEDDDDGNAKVKSTQIQSTSPENPASKSIAETQLPVTENTIDDNPNDDIDNAGNPLTEEHQAADNIVEHTDCINGVELESQNNKEASSLEPDEEVNTGREQQVFIEYTTDDKLFSQNQSESVIRLLSPSSPNARSDYNSLTPTLLDQLSHHGLHQSIYQIALLLDQLMGHLKDVAFQIDGVQSLILRPVTTGFATKSGGGTPTASANIRRRTGIGASSSIHHRLRRHEKREGGLVLANAWYYIIVELLGRLHIPDSSRKRTAAHVKGHLQNLLQDSAELARFILSIQESLEEGKRRFARVIAISKIRLRSEVWKFVGGTDTSGSGSGPGTGHLKGRRKKPPKLKHLYNLNIPSCNENQTHQHTNTGCNSTFALGNGQTCPKAKDPDHFICWRFEDGLSLLERKHLVDEKAKDSNSSSNSSPSGCANISTNANKRQTNIHLARLKFPQRLDVFDWCISEVHELIQSVILRMERARDFLTPLGGLSSLTALSKLSKDVNELSAHLVRRKNTTLWLHHVESHVINQLAKTNKKIDQLCTHNLYNVQFIQGFQANLEKLLKGRKRAVLGQFKRHERINIARVYGQIQLKFSIPIKEMTTLFEKKRSLVPFSQFAPPAPTNKEKVQEENEEEATEKVEQVSVPVASKTNKAGSRSMTTVPNQYNIKPANLEYHCRRSVGKIPDVTTNVGNQPAQSQERESTAKTATAPGLVVVAPEQLAMCSKYIKLYHKAAGTVSVHLQEMGKQLDQVKTSLFLPLLQMANENEGCYDHLTNSTQTGDIRLVELTTWFWIIARALQGLDLDNHNADFLFSNGDDCGQQKGEGSSSNSSPQNCTPRSNNSSEFDDACLNFQNFPQSLQVPLTASQKKEIRRDLKRFVRSIPELCSLIRGVQEEFSKIQQKVYKLESKCTNFQVPIFSHCSGAAGAPHSHFQPCDRNNDNNINNNTATCTAKESAPKSVHFRLDQPENLARHKCFPDQVIQATMAIVLNSAGISINYKGATLPFEQCGMNARSRLLRCFLRRMNEQVHRAISLCEQILGRLKGEIMDSQFQTLAQLLEDMIGNVKEMKKKSISLNTMDHSVARTSMANVQRGLTSFDITLKYLVEQSVGVKEEIGLLPLTLKLVVDSQTSGLIRLRKLFRRFPSSSSGMNFLFKRSSNNKKGASSLQQQHEALTHVKVILRSNEVKTRRQIEEIMAHENTFPNSNNTDNNRNKNNNNTPARNNNITIATKSCEEKTCTLNTSKSSSYLSHCLMLKSHKIQELVSGLVKSVAAGLYVPNAAYTSDELRVSKINALSSMISNGVMELVAQKSLPSIAPHKDAFLQCLENGVAEGEAFVKEVASLGNAFKKFQKVVDPQLEQLTHWLDKGRTGENMNNKPNILNNNNNSNSSSYMWNAILSKLEAENNSTAKKYDPNNKDHDSECIVTWKERNKDLVFQPVKNISDKDMNNNDFSLNYDANKEDMDALSISFSVLSVIERFIILKDILYEVTDLLRSSTRQLTQSDQSLKVAQTLFKEFNWFLRENLKSSRSQSEAQNQDRNSCADEIKQIWLEVFKVSVCLENFKTTGQKMLNDLKAAQDIFRLKIGGKIEDMIQWSCPQDAVECDAYFQSFSTKSKVYSKICQLRSSVKSSWLTPVRVTIPTGMDNFKVIRVNDLS